MNGHVKIEGLDEIQRSLQRLENIGRNMRPILAGIGNIIVNATDEAFEKEGPGWKPLSDVTHRLSYTNMGRSKSKKTTTKAGKTTRGFERYIVNKKILQRSGRLRDSINYQATDTEVTVGSNLPYAAIHQFGGMAGRGRKVKIPARPFLPIENSELRPSVANQILQYLANKVDEEIA